MHHRPTIVAPAFGIPLLDEEFDTFEAMNDDDPLMADEEWEDDVGVVK